MGRRDAAATKNAIGSTERGALTYSSLKYTPNLLQELLSQGLSPIGSQLTLEAGKPAHRGSDFLHSRAGEDEEQR